MQYRTLGRTGIKVSPYCLGAMMFGGDRQPRPRRLRSGSSTRLWMPASISSTPPIATAAGESEEIVGKALKGRRDDIVLATKVTSARWATTRTSRAIRAAGSSAAVEDSLRRLQTDHIDLYQIHRPAPDTDIEETLSALTDLMRAGKVRAIGSSTFPVSEIVEAQWVAERRGSGALPHRAAALFDPRPQHRTRGAARLRALRHGRDGLEPAGEGHAHRPLPQGRSRCPTACAPKSSPSR